MRDRGHWREEKEVFKAWIVFVRRQHRGIIFVTSWNIITVHNQVIIAVIGGNVGREQFTSLCSGAWLEGTVKDRASGVCIKPRGVIGNLLVVGARVPHGELTRNVDVWKGTPLLVGKRSPINITEAFKEVKGNNIPTGRRDGL